MTQQSLFYTWVFCEPPHFLPAVCGGHLEARGSVQNIFSHALYGDANYGNKEDCDWIIEAPPGKIFWNLWNYSI